MLHRSLICFVTFAPHFHFWIVNALFGLILVAIPNAKAAFCVIIRINLTSLTGLTVIAIAYIVPLTFLSIPEWIICGRNFGGDVCFLEFIIDLNLLYLTCSWRLLISCDKCGTWYTSLDAWINCINLWVNSILLSYGYWVSLTMHLIVSTFLTHLTLSLIGKLNVTNITFGTDGNSIFGSILMVARLTTDNLSYCHISFVCLACILTFDWNGFRNKRQVGRCVIMMKDIEINLALIVTILGFIPLRSTTSNSHTHIKISTTWLQRNIIVIVSDLKHAIICRWCLTKWLGRRHVIAVQW